MDKKSISGLIVFMGLPFLLQHLQVSLLLFELGMWLILTLMLLWIYFAEKLSLESIGWKKITLKTLIAGIGLGALFFVVLGLCNAAIQVLGLELHQDKAKLFTNQPLTILLLVALRAAVVEEVLYRGYAFERIYTLTKSKFLAGLLPTILFTLLHLNWGLGHLLFVFIVASLFSLIYAFKRNLGLLIMTHLSVDVITVVVLPILLSQQ